MSKLPSWNRLEISWILYDVGNSAFILLISTVIPIYFKNIAQQHGVPLSDSTAFWGYALSISTALSAVLAPILGTLADTRGFKKPLFVSFVLLGAASCAALALPLNWFLFLAVFVVGRVGIQNSFVFYDSMLHDVTEKDRIDRLSAHGYAWGYIGSCVPFVISLLLIMNASKLGLSTAAATGIAFLLNAVWWLAMSLPLTLAYRQRYYVEVHHQAFRQAFSRLRRLLSTLVKQKQTFFFLLAFFFYIDGVYTIISMATAYGKDVAISDTQLLLALLLTQIIAFPAALAFGRLSHRFATGKLISACIVGYILIVLFALQLDRAWEFWFLAVLVALFQGGIQSLSRAYYTHIIPKENASEYFGLYDIFGKGAAFLGTMLMGATTQLTGSSRIGVAGIAVLLIIGWILFRKAERLAVSSNGRGSATVD